MGRREEGTRETDLIRTNTCYFYSRKELFNKVPRSMKKSDQVLVRTWHNKHSHVSQVGV